MRSAVDTPSGFPFVISRQTIAKVNAFFYDVILFERHQREIPVATFTADIWSLMRILQRPIDTSTHTRIHCAGCKTDCITKLATTIISLNISISTSAWEEHSIEVELDLHARIKCHSPTIGKYTNAHVQYIFRTGEAMCVHKEEENNSIRTEWICTIIALAVFCATVVCCCCSYGCCYSSLVVAVCWTEVEIERKNEMRSGCRTSSTESVWGVRCRH